MLTITHTHAAGTLIDGTSKGDGTSIPLRTNGWRWGPSIGRWYIPHSRDHLPNFLIIDRTTYALQAAGFEVETEIDSASRPTAEVEAGKIQRQADRVDALDAKADRKNSADEATYAAAHAALNRLPPGGEPIHVGHHSERGHRNAIDRADRAMRRSVEAADEATRARARADAAAHTTDARYRPVTVANRIETLGADLRRMERQIIAPCYRGGLGYVDATEAQQRARAARLEPHIAEMRDQIAYWEAVRAAQIESGKATGFDRTNIKKGDRVKIRGTWYVVERANPKTVSVPSGYGWTNTSPYAEIQQHQPPDAVAE